MPSTLFVFLLLVFLFGLLVILLVLNLPMSSKSPAATKDVVPSSEPTWEGFKSTRPRLPVQIDLSRCQIPQELQNIDNEPDVPEKLKQIIAWSLVFESGQSTSKAES